MGRAGPSGRQAGSTGRQRRLPDAARAAILEHYAVHGRALAFRGTRDPYAVLVSEAMAQQTQAARAAERWERFMARFPTVRVLAAASPADVLREWQGLGYDRRGLALWRAARVIVERHDGAVPCDIEELQRLPGVGPYTARAVAALAFEVTVGAVDVNVRRVLGRIVAGSSRALGDREMQALADRSVPPDQPGIWTHAVMDIGAMICRPRAPRCDLCPVRAWCRYAREEGRGESGRPLLTSGAGPGRDVRRVPFEATNRWLRGRILDRLRAARDDHWTVLEAPIGTHGPAAIRAAAASMARDGVLELDGDHATEVLRARLPLA